jgi:excisionase family DNA binding protein
MPVPTSQPFDQMPALLRMQEVARYLAVSVRTAWRLVSLGELESVRIGRSVRVTRKSVEAFLARGGAR